MAYQDLTQQQQADMQVYVQMVRATALKLREAIKDMKGVVAVAALQGNALMHLINGPDTVPDQSNFAGAEGLTKSNVNALRDDFIAVLATYDEATKNNIVIKAIGSANFANNS